MIPVNPKTVTPKIIHYVDAYATELRLDEYAVFCVSLFDNSTPPELIQREYIKIEGEEYANWEGDDTYIKNLILGRFELENPI